MFIALWSLLIASVMVGVTVAAHFSLRTRVATARGVYAHNLKVKNEELRAKEAIVKEIAQLSLGFGKSSVLDRLTVDFVNMENDIADEQGRTKIVQVEFETVEGRLRDLEEMERELEASGVEAAQELEMLRSQEKQVAQRNAQLKVELERSLSQLDKLLSELQFSRSAVEYLTSAKGELTEAQGKLEWYADQVATINAQYMSLKKAYDALDIEYAQLYEKQSSG